MPISDPWFYAFALPAALLVGLGKSGVAGGMGMLAVPLIAQTTSVAQAAALVLPLLTVGDAYGLAALWRERDKASLALLLPAGLLGIALGMLLFGVVPRQVVALVLGCTTLGFVLILWFKPARPDAPPPGRALGLAMGTVSGFTSFLAHAGGPPVAFYLVPKKLPPRVYAATGAVFFAALNLSKWIPYAALGLISATNMLTALVLAPFAALGVWLGLKLLGSISPRWFFRLLSAGLLVTGLKLIWDGLR